MTTPRDRIRTIIANCAAPACECPKCGTPVDPMDFTEGQDAAAALERQLVELVEELEDRRIKAYLTVGMCGYRAFVGMGPDEVQWWYAMKCQLAGISLGAIQDATANLRYAIAEDLQDQEATR